MSEIMSNVKTINSVVRTLMLLGVTGAVGYGGWFGYENYVRPGFEANQAIADLESMRAEFEAQSEEMKRVAAVNERLETSLKLLKVDRRDCQCKGDGKGYSTKRASLISRFDSQKSTSMEDQSAAPGFHAAR